jgi:DNA-binding NtrC family response regulator
MTVLHWLLEDRMQIGVEMSRALENKRIFILSDDEIARAALQFMLHDDYEAHDLQNLSAAYAKASEGRPDLVLLGLEIVAACGEGVLREIAEKLPGTKIMLIAPPGQDALAQSFLGAGAHSVLTKPLTIEGVRRKVGIVFGRGTNAVVQLSIMPGKPR